MSIQTATIAAIRLALGDPAADVSWEAREARWRADRHVLLSMVSAGRQGVDERRYKASGEDDVIERVYAVRRLVIQIKCETTAQSLDASALDMAEVISAGLYRSDVIEILGTAGMGAPRSQPPRVVDYYDQGRLRSAAIFEIQLPYSRTHTGATIGRIKGVSATGTVDGSEVGPVDAVLE